MTESEESENAMIKVSIDFSINPDLSKKEYLVHSLFPVVIRDKHLRANIWSNRLDTIFNSSIINFDISDHVPLSKEMLLGLNAATNTGEFAYSAMGPVNMESGKANLILKLPLNKEHELHNSEIIDLELLRELFCNPHVNALELYLESPCSTCSSFSDNTITALLDFVQINRAFLNGIPIGIRLAINEGEQHRFTELCKAMSKRKIYLDFISILDDTALGINSKSTNSVKSYLNLENAVSFASISINRFQLQQQVKLIATGSINNGFELLKFIALGASSCSATLSAEFLLDSSDQYFMEGSPLFIERKLLNFHRNIIREALQLMEFAGCEHINDIQARMFFRILGPSVIKNFEDLYIKNNVYHDEVINKNFMYN